MVFTLFSIRPTKEKIKYLYKRIFSRNKAINVKLKYNIYI